MRGMEYRLDFFAGLLGATLYNVGALFFLSFTLMKVGSIAGWDIYDLILLHGIGQIWAYLYFFFTYSNLNHFNELIEDGSMDFILLKPLHPIFSATLRNFEFGALVALIQPAAMIGYSLLNKSYTITLPGVLLSIFSIVLSILIVHLLETALSAVAFWTVRSELGRFFYETNEISSYPYEIVKSRFVRIIFLTILPYFLIINVPFRALINRLDCRLFFLQIIILIMFFIIANVAWKAGLKKYQGVS